ncbi:MAG: beta-L-arabinofuranosidase domain-containing protein, partial [Christensenellales bacterium]
LTPNTLAELSLGSIKPEGWLLDQLRTQAEGLTGQLFEVWDDVGENCGWLGGDGDGWERAPYYLDGLIPLAWQLEDERLKGICMRFIEWILESQREDGWFGPADNDDYWPRMVALKALKQYFTATKDKRVLLLMDQFFRYQYFNLSKHPLRDWAVARGGENMHLALWFYNVTGQKYLLELCKRLRAQTLDWPNFFHTFPVTQPMSRSLRWERLSEALEEEKEEALEGEQRPYFRTQYHFSHVVNVAMGLKTPGVINMFRSGFKEQGGFGFGWQKLMKHHGVSYGMFTGDEHLNGTSPTQGTELCAVVELMHTLETLIGVGDFGSELPDILEKLAYNALPAAFNADMTAHQYDQQANQIKVSRDRRNWYNNGEDANLFGFSPNFGCCTANYHQGWPKFVSSLWYATNDGGLSAVSYAPCSVRTRLQGVPTRLHVSGNYPFSHNVSIEVTTKQPVEFPLYLRVPPWVTQPMIFLPDGEIMQVRAGETACIRRKWRTGDVLRLELPTQPRIVKKPWHHQSVTVEYGPLLMAYQPEEKWEKLNEGAFPDWQVTTDSEWGFAIMPDEPQKGVLEPEKAGALGKGEPAAHVLAKAAKIVWAMDGASCANVPILPGVTEEDVQTIKLVPYGGTGLRISQFPLGSIKQKPEPGGAS